MRHGRRAGGATVVAALVGLCVLAGCSNSHGDCRSAIRPPPRRRVPTTTSTTAASSTTTTSPDRQPCSPPTAPAWSAFEHALADANPDDPALAATMVDPQLQG